MKIPYNKPHLSLDKQLELLQNRGLVITDKEKALSCLERIGYYRLSAYWYPFRKLVTPSPNNPTPSKILEEFHEGTSFSHAVDLYVFDKKLRLLLLDALERIEINLRVDIAHYLGKKDIFAHMNPNLLHGDFTKKQYPNGDTKYSIWQKRLLKAIEDSKEEFILHFKNKYTGDMPIWIAVELWDFGLLSTFFQGMKVADKAAIAAKYNIPKWELLESWLHSMNYVRNVCAHHSRIWNRPLARRPKVPQDSMPFLSHITLGSISQLRVYSVIAIIQYMLRIINPTSSWATRLAEHCNSFPSLGENVTVANAGFPTNWKELPLWN